MCGLVIYKRPRTKVKTGVSARVWCARVHVRACVCVACTCEGECFLLQCSATFLLFLCFAAHSHGHIVKYLSVDCVL